jgi:hypothetical protein
MTLFQLLVLFAIGAAVVRYLEWSSDAAQAEFMSRDRGGVLIRVIPANLQLRVSPSKGRIGAIGRIEPTLKGAVLILGPVQRVRRQGAGYGGCCQVRR